MISSVPMKETDECVLKVVGVPGLDQETIHHGNQDNEECTLVLAVPANLLQYVEQLQPHVKSGYFE